MSTDIYKNVTQIIIDSLESGVVPWQQPWKLNSQANLETGKTYRGINAFILSLVGSSLGYDKPYWVTFNQAKKLGGYIKKGSKSVEIIFFNFKKYEDVEEKTGKIIEKKIPILKTYRVFNVSQCANIKHKRLDEIEKVLSAKERIDKAEKIVAGYKNKPVIYFGGNSACYFPEGDQMIAIASGSAQTASEHITGKEKYTVKKTVAKKEIKKVAVKKVAVKKVA